MGCTLLRTAAFFFLFIQIFALNLSYAGKIITPWRAKKEIVRHGASFAIWYQKDTGEEVSAVDLVGPYNVVSLSIENKKNGSWYYDEYTKAQYNCSLSVTVPASTPIELYDLKITSTLGAFFSRSCVKVIHEYLSRYYICHFTDPHVSVCWGDSGNITAPIMQALVDVVDIIDPELLVCTGDNIIGFSRTTKIPAKYSDRWDDFFEGNKLTGLGGMHKCRAPLFITTGNNDYDKYKPNPDSQKMYKLTDWNEFCGMRVFGFAYDQTRFIAFDDYLGELDDHAPYTGPCKDFPAAQITALEKYLSSAGEGQLRIVLEHAPDRVNAAFCNNHSVKLALCGHTHVDNLTTIGTVPTSVYETAYLCFAEYWSPGYTVPNSAKSKLRMIEVNNNAIASNQSIYIMDYIRSMKGQSGDKYLSISYAKPNNGKDTANSATISNTISYSFFGCKIRFVMKKGRYAIDKGTILQSFENDSVSVYDVKIPVNASSTVTVTIRPEPTGIQIIDNNDVQLKQLFAISTSSHAIQLKATDMVKSIQSLQVFDVKGMLIHSFPAKALNAGEKVLIINANAVHAKKVSRGILFVRATITTIQGTVKKAVMRLPVCFY